MTPTIRIADTPTERIHAETARHLAEQFAIAARLYAESVAQLTRDALTSSPSGEEYARLAGATSEALRTAEAAGVAFEEHVTCGTDSP
jgi:3-deoxy-D-arabino-heptulosonate 7-phosphate (DAHP) synthase class II